MEDCEECGREEVVCDGCEQCVECDDCTCDIYRCDYNSCERHRKNTGLKKLPPKAKEKVIARF